MNKDFEDIIAVQDGLIYLVSCAVNDEAPDKARIGEMDLAEVYRLSVAHMLSAAVAFALEKTIPLPYVFDQVKKNAIRKLTLFEVERAAITQKLEQAGIWYLPLKGIVLKDDYPKTAMREMTDIDILCDPSRMADVKQIMRDLGYSGGDYEKDHDVVFTKPPSMVFEMHSRLFDEEHHPLYFDYYGNIREKAIPVGDSRYGLRMTDEDFYVYLICHMYKHYKYTGTGLRSLLDIYVFNKNHRDTIDAAYLDAELKKLKLTDFEHDMRALADKAFAGGSLSDQDNIELERFSDSGVFGTEERAIQYSVSRYYNQDGGKKSVLNYFFHRAFVLTGKDLEKYHPFFYRHKFLYPVLPVYRMGKGIIKHPKRLVDEYKTVKRIKKSTDSDDEK